MAQPWWEERVPPLSRRELFGAPWKGEGPLPLMGVAPQLQPLQGMLLRRSTDIYPKELARVMREFFNSLLSGAVAPPPNLHIRRDQQPRLGCLVATAQFRCRYRSW